MSSMLEMKDGKVMAPHDSVPAAQRHLSVECLPESGAALSSPRNASAITSGLQPQVSKSKLQGPPANRISAPHPTPHIPMNGNTTLSLPSVAPTTAAKAKVNTNTIAKAQVCDRPSGHDGGVDSVFAQMDRAPSATPMSKSPPAQQPISARPGESALVPTRGAATVGNNNNNTNNNSISSSPAAMQPHVSGSFTISTRAPATTAAVVVSAATNPLANQPAHPVTFFAHSHGVSSPPRSPLRATRGDGSDAKGRAGVAIGPHASGIRSSLEDEARTSLGWGRRISARNETLSGTGQRPFSVGDNDGQDWLQVPQLFYLFANLIILHELQLQRRMAMDYAAGGPIAHGDDEDDVTVGEQEEENNVEDGVRGMRDDALIAAPHASWTVEQEEQLEQLYKRVTYAMREINQVFFRSSLVVWSNPSQRELVRRVTSLWQKDRDGEVFEQSLLQLLDAISRDESGQVRFTKLYRCWAFLNSSTLRIIAAVVLTGLALVCLAGTALLAVFGRRSVGATIALSIVVGVCSLVHYGVALGCVYRGYRDHTAAQFFREEALIAIKASIDKDSDDEFGDEMEDRLSGIEGNVGRAMFTTMGSHGSRRVHEFDPEANLHSGAMGPGNGTVFCGDGGFLCAVDALPPPLAATSAVTPLGGAAMMVTSTSTMTTTAAAAASASSRLRSGSHNNNNSNHNNHNHHSCSGSSGTYHTGGGPSGRGFNGFTTLIPCPPPLPTTSGAGRQQNHASADSQRPSLDRQLEEDRENALLMSGINFRQYQHHIDQHQERVLRSSIVGAGPDGVPIPLPPPQPSQADRTASENESLHSADTPMATATAAGAAASATAMRTTPPTTKEIFDELREHINVTALMYCDDDTVAAQVALTLWRCNFLVIRAARLEALAAAYHRGSERFKVFLLHAPDLAEGSEALRTALEWVSEKRPVYFFSSDVGAYAVQLPVTACLELPLSEPDCNALLLAGLGIDEMNTSMTTPSATPFKVPAYTLGRRLGGGAFGNVFEAQMEKTGARCAVKRMYLRDHDDEAALEETIGDGEGDDDNRASNQLREIAQEVEIMSSLSHPNIVQYMFCERDDNCISIFMELCTGGSLTTMIKNHRLVDPEQVRHILTDVISAVAYLHSKRIVHRDLKPDNVLFRDGKAKVTDFGTAVHKRGNLRMMKGTFAYMAPEIVLGEPYGKSCDVWSIGCIAAEVLSVELPQHSLGLPEMSEFYRKMDLNAALEINCEVPQVRNFLLACLQRNPHARETAAQLLQHEMLHAGSTPLRRWLEKVAERRRSGHRPAMSGGSKLSRRNVSGTSGADDNTDDLFSDENASLQSSKLLVSHTS